MTGHSPGHGLHPLFEDVEGCVLSRGNQRPNLCAYTYTCHLKCQVQINHVQLAEKRVQNQVKLVKMRHYIKTNHAQRLRTGWKLILLPWSSLFFPLTQLLETRYKLNPLSYLGFDSALDRWVGRRDIGAIISFSDF